MTKIRITLLIFFAFFPILIQAQTSSFIAIENGKPLIEEGETTLRHSPCSTFKIAISLMGFDSGILQDLVTPQLPFKPEYDAPIDSWKKAQTPQSWMATSCVWFSQEITTQLGKKTFDEYVKKFNYGNKNTFGDREKGDGLTQSWLCSSLEISPYEQVVFLKKMLTYKLPINSQAIGNTQQLLFLEKLPNGFSLYGKTGSGFYKTPDGNFDRNRPIGWFVGWIKNESRTIIFAYYLEDSKPFKSYGGYEAKTRAKEALSKLINTEK